MKSATSRLTMRTSWTRTSTNMRKCKTGMPVSRPSRMNKRSGSMNLKCSSASWTMKPAWDSWLSRTTLNSKMNWQMCWTPSRTAARTSCFKTSRTREKNWVIWTGHSRVNWRNKISCRANLNLRTSISKEKRMSMKRKPTVWTVNANNWRNSC